MCPLYICMHTHAGPLVLSFARHAPLPFCLAAWAEHRNCFCFVFIALSGRPLSLPVCVLLYGSNESVCAGRPTLRLFFYAFGGNHCGRSFFFSTLPSLIVSSALFLRGVPCVPAQLLHSHTTDTLMTTALCASPAARMRRGRDERRAEGAVTCGRAARACGAEHTFLSLLFCFLCGQGGQTPAAPHTQPRPAAVFFFPFAALTLPMK
ncbi:hypothetical protein TCDM_11133 [Trypanosoma cruzi Dm28c]|uniref:ATPase n=1 Tax=Trypanosoma cruzi Dm28c TaxID=1416333 RepID=V5B157_TRYCR|nr:hypothetical protein TCDM_11133 [Trypanosoma cruzi Dm28c]